MTLDTSFLRSDSNIPSTRWRKNDDVDDGDDDEDEDVDENSLQLPW